jgi:hypothetical protein
VDKSLDSVFNLNLVQELFPSARYVLLYRHVMDTVASGIEASPWGFQAYGYGPYVQASPQNSVAALANYWLAHVTAALAWEETHADSCLRVRYEDLVQDPADVLRDVFRFLGVDDDRSVLVRAFEQAPGRGPGDYKVAHTSVVHAKSVGHGKRVPVGLLPPALLEAVNDKLETLGYGALDRAWNAQERPFAGSAETVWTERFRSLMHNLRIPPGLNISVGVDCFALVAEDDPLLRWIVDLEAGRVVQGDGEVDQVLTGTVEDLVLMLTDEENLGVLLRSGRIRHLAASEDDAPPDVPGTVENLIRVVRAEIGSTREVAR